MTVPTHFDLDAIEKVVRDGFAQADREARADPDANRALCDVQSRAVDLNVALHRFITDEGNRGTASRHVVIALANAIDSAVGSHLDPDAAGDLLQMLLIKFAGLQDGSKTFWKKVHAVKGGRA